MNVIPHVYTTDAHAMLSHFCAVARYIVLLTSIIITNFTIDSKHIYKECRYKIIHYLIIKHAVCNLLIPKTVNIPNLIKIGEACVFHGEFVMIRSTLF